MKNILIGFDVDETLLFTDHEKDKAVLYRKINVVKFNDRMKKFLEALVLICPENVFILTARAESCKQQLIDMFGVTQIFFVNEDFKSQEDMEAFFKVYKYDVSHTVQRKIDKLKELKDKSDMVLYYDDLFDHVLFKQLSLENSYIRVLSPLTN